MDSLFDRLQSEVETSQQVEGITPADLPDISPELRNIVNMILRQGEMSLAEIAFQLDMKPSEVTGLLETLVEKGYVRVFEAKGEQRYKTFLTRRRRREVPLNIWEALGSKVR